MRAHRLVIAALLMPAIAIAHPGGLNKEGCHNDRKSGGYHCHRSAAPAPAPARPAPAGIMPLTGSPESKTDTVRSFRNCTEARAAGAAPVRRGDPGYGAHLDRDGDGVGCE